MHQIISVQKCCFMFGLSVKDLCVLGQGLKLWQLKNSKESAFSTDSKKEKSVLWFVQNLVNF